MATREELVQSVTDKIAEKLKNEYPDLEEVAKLTAILQMLTQK